MGTESFYFLWAFRARYNQSGALGGCFGHIMHSHKSALACEIDVKTSVINNWTKTRTLRFEWTYRRMLANDELLKCIQFSFLCMYLRKPNSMALLNVIEQTESALR